MTNEELANLKRVATEGTDTEYDLTFWNDRISVLTLIAEVERLRASEEQAALSLRAALQNIYDWYMDDANEDRGGHALEVAGAALGLEGTSPSAEPSNYRRLAEPTMKRVCPDSEDGTHVLKQDGPFSVVYCDACGMNRGWRGEERTGQTHE